MAAEPLPQNLPRDRSSTSPSTGPRRADRQDRVVQSMAHKVTRPCRRSGCPAPARASMVLDYAGKQVTLVPLLEERDPRFLELCPSHAASLDVPRGWDLVDDRDEEPAEPTGPPTAAEMGSSATVAVLAAALREPAEPEEPVGPESVDDLVDASHPVAPRPTLVEPTEPVAAGDTRPTAPSGRTAQPVHPDRRQRPTDQRQLPLEGTLPGEEGDRAPAPGDRVAAPRPVPAAREPRRTSSS